MEHSGNERDLLPESARVRPPRYRGRRFERAVAFSHILHEKLLRDQVLVRSRLSAFYGSRCEYQSGDQQSRSVFDFHGNYSATPTAWIARICLRSAPSLYSINWIPLLSAP